MQNLKKLTALSLAAAMLGVFSGCGDQSWSYRTKDNAVSLSAGTYIFNLLNGYYEAYGMVETPDEAEDILKEKVTDSDTEETKTVEQFALDSADEETTNMVAVESLFKKYGLELDEDEYDSYSSYSSQVWSTMKTTCEEYGISEESFNYCYAEYQVKSSQVFKALYLDKDGEKFVDDDELINYYKDKYTGYAYFSLSMTDYDDEGNATPKSEEEVKKAEKNFKAYAEEINKDKKSYKDVVSEHIENYELTADPTYSGSYDKEDNNLQEDVAASLDKLKEGEAEFVKSGEDDSAMYYLVYKPVTDDIVDFLEFEDEDSKETPDEASELEVSVESEDTPSEEVNVFDLKTGYSRSSLLQDMKGDEFKDYLKDYAKGLNIEKNSAVLDKFKPKMFVKDDEDED